MASNDHSQHQETADQSAAARTHNPEPVDWLEKLQKGTFMRL